MKRMMIASVVVLLAFVGGFLAITELLLPRLSGFELIRQVRASGEGADIPILLVTGLARDMTSINVLKRSFNVDLLVKPFTPWDFALSVQKLVAPLRAPATRQNSRPGLGKRKKQPTGAFGPEETQPGLRSPTLVDMSFDVPGLRDRDQSDMSVEATTPTTPTPRRYTQGLIADHPLPELLLDGLEKRLSGTLALRLHDVKKVIYLLSGHPIYVQSNLRRETIGQTLVSRGEISADQNTKALAEAKRGGFPYGQALVQLGLLTAGQVKQELLTNIRHKIQASLDWNRGNWLFVEDQGIGSKVPRCVLDPVPLVFEGLKRQADPEKSLQRMSRHVELEIVIPERIKHYRETFGAVFGEIVLNCYQDEMTINDLAAASGNPQEAMFQLDILLRCGLARVRNPNASVHKLPSAPADKDDSEEAIIVDQAPVRD